MHILSRCQKGRDGNTPFETARYEANTRVRTIWRESACSTSHRGAEEQDEPQESVSNMAWNEKQQCRMFYRNTEGVFRAREIRRLEPRDKWDTEAIRNVIGVPWRMTDGRWTVDRPERSSSRPHSDPSVAVQWFRGRESPSRTSMNSDQVAMQSRTTKEDRQHSDRCRRRIEQNLRKTPHGAERLDRRDEVINEALAEEVRRGEQREGK